MNLLTYLCELDHLDGREARFTAGDSGTELTLSRENWVDIGRPSQLYITPSPENPYDRLRKEVMGL